MRRRHLHAAARPRARDADRKTALAEEQRESGLAALGMGMVGITEGAIPFAAADPVRVIPSIMAGSIVAAFIAMLPAWVTTRRTAGPSSSPSSITG